MTLSILALDPVTGDVGGAAATGNLCVGAWVLRAEAGVGVSASQGTSVSTLWGEAALARMRAGLPAAEAVAAVTAADPGRAMRQLTALDPAGGVGAFTGDGNEPWRGHRTGPGLVAAGNWLASDSVLEAIETAFLDSGAPETPFAARLIGAIAAGAAAGGDARGVFSAAVKVVSRDRPPLDLRVDYDEAPLPRLRDLLARATAAPYADWVAMVPTLSDPHRS